MGLGAALAPAPGAVPREPLDPVPAAGVAGPRGPDPYFPDDGNEGIDVLSYVVRDRYDLPTGRLVGSTRLRVRATQPLHGFHLDLLLPVRGVRVDGRPARWSRPTRHEVRVETHRAVPTDGVVTVEVAYAGRPGGVGWPGRRGWVAGPHEVAAIGQPRSAPWWFAANDHPSDKATMDVAITTGADLDVVSVGRRVSRRPAGPGLVTTRWRAGAPMAPYLAFFVAGDLEVRRGRRLGLPFTAAVSRAVPQPQRRRAMRVLLRSPAVVRWLERRVGPYPFGTTGGVVTSLNPGFALETQTRPVYPVVDASAAPTLLVHELAHQWFGDAVTVRRWSDTWLNEGPATWAEVAWTASRGGPSAAATLQRWYDDRAAESGFWDFPLADPGPARILDRAVYVRGAMVLLALGQRVGEPGLQRVLRTWVARHGGATAGTADFEALATEVTGVDLDGFFRAWLHTPAPPDRTAANGLVPDVAG